MSQRFIVAGPIDGLYHVLYKVPGTIIHSSVGCAKTEALAQQEADLLNDQETSTHAKDWHARGEKAGNAKLKDAEVAEIKTLLSRGRSISSIAKQFKVSSMCISRINSGKTWSHLNG